MSLSRFLVVRAARAFVLPEYARIARFLRDCETPERVQAELLLGTVRRQAGTAFGRDHGFSTIRTVADFRRQVPIAPYERLAPYIERLKAGDTNALLADDALRMFALTSGTTSARKFIPVTDRYMADYKRAWRMWGVRAYRDNRERDLPLRPIVQMVSDPDEFRSAGGIPCGNMSGYTAGMQSRFFRRQYVLPAECGKLKDPAARYYLAVRLALCRPVALWLAANPSTLTTLAKTLDAHKERLLRDLHDGTIDAALDLPADIRAVVTARVKPDPAGARRLTAMADKLGRLYPQDVWPPERTLLGTWTGGSMGPYLRQLPTYFGPAAVRDLGLTASEGRFTIPFANDTPSAVLDIWSHHYEFIPEGSVDAADPPALGVHELEVGKAYFIVPTTAAGLYRYHISDLVRVTGFVGRTPTVEFLGKGNRFANMTGEKLSEHHVTQAVEAVARRGGYSPPAYAAVPVWDDAASYYRVLLEPADESAVRRFVTELDRELRAQNVEYDAKRESGRLGPVRAGMIPAGAWAGWDVRRLVKTGGSVEQYKRPCLIADPALVADMEVTREVG